LDNVYDYTKIISSPIKVSRRRVTCGWVSFIHPKLDKTFKLELQVECCEGKV